MHRRCPLAAVLIAAAGVAWLGGGCSSGGTNAHSTAPSRAGRGETVRVDEQANGTVVSLRAGGSLVVTLASTSWKHEPPGDTAVLHVVAPPTSATGASCPAFPGSGCGTVTATYTGGHAGTTQLAAHRDSCGEALRCTGTQGDWSIRVRVS